MNPATQQDIKLQFCGYREAHLKSWQMFMRIMSDVLTLLVESRAIVLETETKDKSPY